MSMKRLKLQTVFRATVELAHHSLLVIKPDKKYNNITHIKTNYKDHKKRDTWFHVRHNYGEVLDMYYQIKKNLGRR